MDNQNQEIEGNTQFQDGYQMQDNNSSSSQAVGGVGDEQDLNDFQNIGQNQEGFNDQASSFGEINQVQSQGNQIFQKPILRPLGVNNGIKNDIQNINTGVQNIDLDYPANLDSYTDLKGKILSIATLNKASDIYVASGFEVGVKVHGKIFPISSLGVLDDDKVNGFLDSVFTDKQKNKFKEELELDFSYSWKDLDGIEKRFRMNAFHQSRKPSVAIRYLVNENNTIDSLGLPEILKALSERNSGIILVCGVTGSGKSTTIAAMIDHINTNFAKHIISIEDPIEYIFEKKKSWIEQREVGTDTVSFQRAMKSALRQNPNVLFLGEMRDLESIAAAISIAESGHLVLSTIHARNSVQCINKIIDGFPADQQNQIRIQLSEALGAILTQKLIPSKRGKGQELVMEIMINKGATANLIRENQTHQIESIIQTSSKEGMRLLDFDIIRLINEDKISIEDGIKHSNDPTWIEKMLKESRMI